MKTNDLTLYLIIIIIFVCYTLLCHNFLFLHDFDFSSDDFFMSELRLIDAWFIHFFFRNGRSYYRSL